MEMTIKVRILKLHHKGGETETKVICNGAIAGFTTDTDYKLRIPLLLEIEGAVKAKIEEINQRLNDAQDNLHQTALK